jgi:putative ABC transport system permease protein
LSTKAADRLKVGVGDKVKFYLSSTYIEIKIYGIYDAFYGNSIIIHYDCPLLSAPYNDFQSAWVDSKPGVDLETLRSSLLEVDYVRLVDTSAEWIARVESIVSSISTMTMAIKIFAILLAIVVIYNLGLLNFRERVREIATLKVVGFHTAEIAAGLLIEALSMAAIGIAIGTLFGFPFMQLVLMINQIDVIHYIYMIYPVTYIAAAFASFFAAIVVNISLMIRIKSVHAVESLKSIE